MESGITPSRWENKKGKIQKSTPSGSKKNLGHGPVTGTAIPALAQNSGGKEFESTAFFRVIAGRIIWRV